MLSCNGLKMALRPSTLVLDSTFTIVRNKDSMNHHMKGDIGLFCTISDGLFIDGVDIDGVMIHGDASTISLVDGAVQEGAAAAGMLVTQSSEKVFAKDLTIANVDSTHETDGVLLQTFGEEDLVTFVDGKTFADYAVTSSLTGYPLLDYDADGKVL